MGDDINYPRNRDAKHSIFFHFNFPAFFYSFYFCRHLVSLIFIRATCVIVQYWSDILQNKKRPPLKDIVSYLMLLLHVVLTPWTNFCLAEIGCRSEPVCLHLHSGPSHLDQPAVLGSHFLQRGPESDPIPLSQHPRGERGHQAKGKTWQLTNVSKYCVRIHIKSV